MKILNSYRINTRREAKQTLSKVDNINQKILFIHYSCESFYDNNGITPRITCIGVLNKENNESKVFSLHLYAQILKKNLNKISSYELNNVEKQMLKEFSEFALTHSDYIWIHWNMRSANYGFQAISNRYRILGGKIISIPDNNKIDLQELLGKFYTYSFEKHSPNGQLLNLAERNKISMRDAMIGKDEAKAFDDKEFLKLQMSTMRKVEIINRLFTAHKQEKLKHNAKLREIYDLSIPGMIALVKESPVLLVLWSILVFVLGSAMEPLIQKIFGTGN